MVNVRVAERSWTHDRSDWSAPHMGGTSSNEWFVVWPHPQGPWHHEPDKVQWLDLMTGYACLAVRNHWGSWCGYVGVPPGHRYHSVNYMAVEDEVRVHGGLTFSDACQEDAPEGHGICHIAEPGEPDHVWWLGFDCGHAWDLQPRFPHLRGQRMHLDEVYRPLAYVQDECADLARQLAPRLLPSSAMPSIGH